MRVRVLALLTCLLISILALSPAVRAAGVGVSAPGHVNVEAAAADSFLFFPRRPGSIGQRMNRDLEFSLSASYSRTRGDAIPGLTVDDHATLLNFAKTLVDTTANPFSAPYPDLRLVHDYFNKTGVRYDTNPAFPGFLPSTSESYPTADRSHVDHYIFEPGLDGNFSGRHPAYFRWQKEDSSTGWWTSPSSYEVLGENSTSYPGPPVAGIQDLSGTGWTRPDATANWGAIHEIHHYFSGDGGSAADELVATAAEVLAGALPTAAATFDVNYTWGLLDNFLSPQGSGVTHTSTNYAAWRQLSAYVLTNFRNQDTTATLPPDGTSGLADDLMYRWAHRESRTLEALGSQLVNDSCYTCSQKAAFLSGATPLPPRDRVNVLLHNWRVANFVNNPFLAPDADGHGMYGYPPQFGFSPTQDVGAWSDNDTASAAYNVVVFPTEVTARPSWTSKDTVISVERTRDAVTYPLRLRTLGSEYWVIRSTSGIPGGKELIVRVAADSIHWQNSFGAAPTTCTGTFADQFTWTSNLSASLVGYTDQSDSLWDEGSWASQVAGPVSVDIDSLAGELQFSLPGFGTQYKAAVLVITAGLGPFGSMSKKTNFGQASDFQEATRYRLNLALRDTSTADVNPRTLVESMPTEDHPTWSPDGGEIVYSSGTTPYAQLYRVAAAGGTPSLLVGGSAHERTPDWSPRGDYIVYVEEAGDTSTTIRRLNYEDPELEALTSGATQAVHPAFSPNGQRVAYGRRTPGLTTWSLRSVNIDGTGDAAVSTTTHANPISSIRWTADGSFIYYVSGGRIHGVPASGGASTQRDNVVANLGSFDLPRGAGRMLLEEIGATKYFCDGVNNFVPYRRLALRDTTVSPRDTEMRFYRTGTSFYSPRYSPNNRFVAYRSDQNSVGAGDLYVGELIWDRAPTFNVAINDTTVWEGQGLTIDIRATDPDGDAVSYAGAHLPSGASIVSGYLLWPTPTLSNAPHYIALRALSPGGAVVSKVVRIDVTPRPVAVSDLQLGTGRNTAALAWSEPNQPGGEADSYEIRYLANSTITELNFSTGALVSYGGAPGPEATPHCVEPSVGSCTAYSYAIRTIRDGVPSFISNVASGSTTCSGSSMVFCMFDGLYGGGDGGGESLRHGFTNLASQRDAGLGMESMRENSMLGHAQGSTGSDLMRLSGDAGPIEGTYRVRLRQSAPMEVNVESVTLGAVDHDPAIEAIASPEGVLLGTLSPVGGVRGADGAVVEVAGTTYRPGDALTVELGGTETALVITASGPAVQPGGDSTGILVQVQEESEWRTQATVHPRRHAEPQAIDVAGASTVRLVFATAARIENLLQLEVVGRAQPTPMALVSATHSGGEDVTSAVNGSESEPVALVVGEELSLAFTASEIPVGKSRTLFLGAQGAHRAAERSTTASSAASPAEVRELTFALGAARPNPTTGRVTIGYSLAQSAKTRIEIYGVTGRLVRTLVEGTQEAGAYDVAWDGRSNSGTSVAPGVYFYRMEAGPFRSEKKVVVVQP